MTDQQHNDPARETANASEGDSRLKRYLATGKHWPIMLVVLFVSQASIVLGTAVIASGPGSKPIDDGYYARSLEWDAEHALRRRADDLGWTIKAQVGGPSGVPTQRVVHVELLDATGAAIENAVVELEGYHRSRSDQRVTSILGPARDGGYEKAIVMRRDGLWDFQIHIRARGEVLHVTEVIDVGG